MHIKNVGLLLVSFISMGLGAMHCPADLKQYYKVKLADGCWHWFAPITIAQARAVHRIMKKEKVKNAQSPCDKLYYRYAAVYFWAMKQRLKNEEKLKEVERLQMINAQLTKRVHELLSAPRTKISQGTSQALVLSAKNFKTRVAKKMKIYQMHDTKAWNMNIKNIGFAVLILMHMAMHAMNAMRFSPITMEFSTDFVAKYTRQSKAIEGEENYEFIIPETIEQALDAAKAAERRAQEAKSNHERNSYLTAACYFGWQLYYLKYSKAVEALDRQKNERLDSKKQLASAREAKEAAEIPAALGGPQSNNKPSSSLNNKGQSDD